MKEAVGYIRVSTAQQVAEGVSLEAQRARIAAWAVANDYNLVAVYEDAGISGKNITRREGLQRALNHVARDTALIVYSLSRLARSTKDAIAISEHLNKRGADLVSLSEKIDTTSAAGKMVFRLMAVMAEFERDLISERVSGAMQHLKRKGEKAGYVPFGLRVAENGRTLENDPQEQLALAQIRQLREASMSFERIAQHLNDAGIRTRSGTGWKKQYVHSVLRNKSALASYRGVSV